MSNNLKITFVLPTLNIYMYLSTLFIASKNNTSSYLEKYLKLTISKQYLTNHVLNLYNNISQIINLHNFMILPYSFKLNTSFFNDIPIIKIINYDSTNNKIVEADKLNKYITNVSKIKDEIIIKPNYIDDNNIISLITGTIEPIWESNFDKIVLDEFFSYSKRSQRFLVSQNKNYYYSKYDSLELIELKNINKSMSFGIIYTKSATYPSFTPQSLNILIDNLKLTQFKYLIIPEFSQLLKFKYNNIFINENLDLFKSNSVNISNMIINNNLAISDFIHFINIKITKNKNTTPNNNNINNYIKSIGKKINTPFVYYVRLNTVNTIYCIGHYS
jgi:hypothetical protein